MENQGQNRFSELAKRVGGDGADAWAVHMEAVERKRKGDDVVILTIGQETVAPTPAPIVEAAVESLRSGRHHYSEISGEPDLRAAIASEFARLTGVPVSTGNCAVFAGAQNALFASSLCTLGPGDDVIVIEPYYATYHATFTAGGARLTRIHTDPLKNFQFEPAHLQSKLTDKTRADVINSPNHPAGVVYDKWRVRELVRICKENGLWLISDEVYSTLAEPGSFSSPASVPGAFDICVTVSSVSKSHRMTGWRLGWVVASEELISHLHNLSLCMAYGLPMFVQDAATYAISKTVPISNQIREHINRKRSMVISQIEKIEGISVRGSTVGMFVLFDVRRLGVPDKEFAWHLLNDYDIAVLPCDAFGQSGAGLLRINVGESEDNLRRSCEMIRRCVADFRNKSMPAASA